MPTTKASDATRERILGAAFAEFYRHGFQGGRLDRIVAAAGITKGALFHHFADKQQLGYAVVDEAIEPIMRRRWMDPLADSEDPVGDLQHAFLFFVRADIDSGAWHDGCPLNNLAQEMSPLDEGFRGRIDALYAEWREAFAAALQRGIAAGTVRRDVQVHDVAAFLVAAQMGIWGTGKYSHDAELMQQACDATCDYLASLAA